MATNPQALMSQALGGQASGVPSAPPDQSQSPQTQSLEPPDPDDTSDNGLPVKIVIRGSRRMIHREALRQVFPLVAQYLFNGQYLQSQHQIGKTVDYEELFRMLEEATGIQGKYAFIRPMTQQEQQAFSQPPPGSDIPLQKAQLETQTRLQIAQQKFQTETRGQDVEADIRRLEAEEESATAILKLIQEERAALQNNDPQQKMLDLKARMAEIAADRQSQQQNLQQSREKHQFDMIAQAQKHQQSMQQQTQQSAHQALTAHLLGGIKIAQADAERKLRSKPDGPTSSQ